MLKRNTKILACIMTALTFTVSLTACNSGNTSMRYDKAKINQAKRNNPVKNSIGEVPTKTKNFMRNSNVGVNPNVGTTRRNLATNIGSEVVLMKIQSNCEDILKDINQGNWSSCKKRCNTINRCRASLQPQLGTSLVGSTNLDGLSKSITKLNAAVNKRDALLTKMRANEVAKHIPKIAMKAKHHTTAEVSKLRATVSEIPTYMDAKKLAEVKTSCAKATKEWMPLKKKLHSTYKSDAAKMDDLLKKLDKAAKTGTPSEIKTCSKNVADQIVVIENDLSKQTKNK